MKLFIKLGASLALLLVLATVAIRLPVVQDALLSRAIEQKVTSYQTHLFEDPQALNIIFCGTGSPIPTVDRAGSCIGVIAGQKMYVIDTGPRSTNNLNLWRIPLKQVKAVLLTHFHSDHIDSLGQLNQFGWIDGRSKPLTVYGGQGVENVVEGFNRAYSHNGNYRRAYMPEALAAGAQTMVAKAIDFDDTNKPVEVIKDGDLTIKAFNVDHGIVKPALGFYIEYKGRTAVISGDTGPFPALAKIAQGADVLIHEGVAELPIEVLSQTLKDHNRARLGKIMGHASSYHTPPKAAAELAKQAGVKQLLFYHLIPPMNNKLNNQIFLRGTAEVWDGDIQLAFDGLRVRLPAQSSQIEHLDVRL